MGFLSVLYAVSFVFAAFVGYAFCGGNAKAKPFRWRVFWAISGFGATSYIGFILAILALGQSPLAFLLEGKFRTVIYLLAYLLPGSIGAWLCDESVRSVTPST